MASSRQSLTAAPAALGVLLAAACSVNWNPQVLSVKASPAPAAGTGSLQAGFGRADITPPPGVGLAGNGPEGFVSTGYRHRLYVRALLLEDPTGERIALVALDQAHISANLHRLAADQLADPETTRIGADRLIISATHTHSGGSHFYGERQLNGSSSRLGGYDSMMVKLLVKGIVSAVRQANKDLKPAKAAWGFQTVKGYTKNRSFTLAYCRNPAAVRTPCWAELGGREPDSLTRSVDTVWKLLRIDQDVARNGVYRPAGAYSVLAIHGTGNPTSTTLLDGDIHAGIERRLERLIDSVNGKGPGYVADAVHVFANGTEGDASPNRPPETQCPLPKLRAPAFAGPREYAAPWNWADADSTRLAHCFAAARKFIDETGRVLGDSAFANFERLGPSLRSDFPIRRAFATLPLADQEGLCPTPEVGTSAAAGASDVPTRVAGWRVLGIWSAGFEQGGHAIRKPPRGCQAEKRPLLGGLQGAVIVREHGLPEVAQISLVQMGQVFLATVPAEPTTTTGRLIGDAVGAAVRPVVPQARVIVVALTNGFMQYVATREEYAGQTYEGGSTIYGPATAEFFAHHLAQLGTALAASPAHSPPADVAPITAYPGTSTHILPDESARPRLSAPRALTRPAACLPGGELRVTWRDEPPGRLLPGAGQVLAIEEERTTGWTAAAWDDQDDVVVRAERRVKNGYEWSVTMSRGGLLGRTLRLRLLAGHGQPELKTDGFPGCAGPPG